MKIENQNVTINAMKLGSFILGLISITWIISSKIIMFQTDTNSRFERIETKIETVSQQTKNGFILVENKRKVDSAGVKNDLKDLKQIFTDFTKTQFYSGRPISSN
jgi:hypothetical protein